MEQRANTAGKCKAFLYRRTVCWWVKILWYLRASSPSNKTFNFHCQFLLWMLVAIMIFCYEFYFFNCDIRNMKAN
jgi:hypothetical protein